MKRDSRREETEESQETSEPAVVVSQGDNRAHALVNIREAIELYVEECREAGDPVHTEAGVDSADTLCL